MVGVIYSTVFNFFLPAVVLNFFTFSACNFQQNIYIFLRIYLTSFFVYSKFLSFPICHSVIKSLLLLLSLLFLLILLLFSLSFSLLLKALSWLLLLSVLLFSHFLIFGYHYCLFCFFSTCPDLLLFPIFIVLWRYDIITVITSIIIFISFLMLFCLFVCLFCFGFSFYFWLSNYFSHMKRLRLVNFFVCLFVLFIELKFYGNNSQLYCFSPVPKRFKILFICCHFNIILHFILNFTIFVATRFSSVYSNRFYGSYQSVECIRSTSTGFFLGEVHWQWPWTLLRTDPRVFWHYCTLWRSRFYFY